MLFVLYAVPTIVPVATFAAYLLVGHTLSAAEAFTALALFNVLRFPLFMLPQVCGGGGVSGTYPCCMLRVQGYLVQI